MKLYIYEHCPFCTRARMIIGLHKQTVELVYLNNDDEMTPISLIGTKQVPILQKRDGTYMSESLDIVRYLDQQAQPQNPINETIRAEIQTWFQTFNEYGNRLIMPRDIQLNMPEFATQSAIDYFVAKKEKTIGSFQDNLANTAPLLIQANEQLTQLDQLLSANLTYLNGENLSMEDILIFPLLRNLSMVKGLIYPKNLLYYTQNMAKLSQVPLFFDRAI